MASACLEMREPAVGGEEKTQNVFLNPASADGYLKGSHFSIGQDLRLNENCLQTAYKHDYPPLPLHGRQPAVPHKASKQILPGDDRYMGEQTKTETQSEYTRKELKSKHDIEMLKQRLGATHYKQHKDDRTPLWETTHKLDFQPRMLSKPTLAKAVTDGNLVFGDKDKAEKPLSSYNSAYIDYSGDDIRPGIVKASAGPSTLVGDIRATTYQTTNKEHFVPQPNVKQHGMALRECVDLFGTKGKPFEGVSEFNEKFTKLPISRSAPSKHRSFQTTFSQKDGFNDGFWDTTHKTSFVPMPTTAANIVTKESNKSNVPLGGKVDGNEMVTNYQRNYLGWKPRTREMVNNDSDMKYKSQLVFGDPAQAGDFYETTHATTYQPVKGHRPAKANPDLQNSNLPLDNWSSEVNIPTYNDDFRELRHDLLDKSEHRLLVEKLQSSNIKMPTDGDLHWRTTHKSHFTPKRPTAEKGQFDARRFQHSHITFGDHRIQPFNMDCY